MRQQTYQLIEISYHFQHIEHLVQTDGKMAVKKNYLTLYIVQNRLSTACKWLTEYMC